MKDRTELLDGRRASSAIGRLVHAARQPDRCVGIGEWVHAVHDEARRPPKASRFGILDRVDDPSVDHQIRDLGRERAEVIVGHDPVRAVIEVEQRHVHGQNLNLASRFKVKGYGEFVNIGELSATCGVATQTIRFYERRGLLPEPQRQPNGYRTYDQATIDRIAFIRRAQRAGLTLNEILGVLDVRAEGRAPCGHVAELLTDKLGDVNTQLRELRTLRRELEGLIERSHHLNPADCSENDICHVLGPAMSGRSTSD